MTENNSMTPCQTDNRIPSTGSFPSKSGSFPARSSTQAKAQPSLRAGAGGVGGLVAVSVDGDYYFPGYDNNGNVIGYWNEDGEIVAEYAYDAFGNTIYEDGDMADFFPHRFSTKYYDADSDLYYYGYRHYSPSLGRWISRDPIEEEGGNNLFVFCENNSIVQIDAFGRNIYLLEGGGTTKVPPIDNNHQDVCVSVWNESLSRKCRLACFSFVANLRVRPFLPSLTWLGWFEPTPIKQLAFVGEIKEQTGFVLKKNRVVAKKTTTRGQDVAWLNWMRRVRIGTTDLYTITHFNCRLYSQKEFDDAPGIPWRYP